MGALKFITFILSVFGKKKKQDKHESLEELKFQDSIRREEKKKTPENWHQSQKVRKVVSQEVRKEQVCEPKPIRPYEKVIRMLRTEKKRQRILSRKAELENLEKKKKEESMIEEIKRKRAMSKEHRREKERQRQMKRLGLIKERKVRANRKSQQGEVLDHRRLQGIRAAEKKEHSSVYERVLFSLTLEEGPFTIKHCVRLVTVD